MSIPTNSGVPRLVARKARGCPTDTGATSELHDSVKSTRIELKLRNEVVHHEPVKRREDGRKGRAFTLTLECLARWQALISLVHIDVRKTLICFSEFFKRQGFWYVWYRFLRTRHRNVMGALDGTSRWFT